MNNRLNCTAGCAGAIASVVFGIIMTVIGAAITVYIGTWALTLAGLM
jgi:hypothetical protein